MNYHRTSIIRRFLSYSVGFGILLGSIFPFFATYFVASWKSEKMFYIFCTTCVISGIAVGLVGYFIYQVTIMTILKDMSLQMADISGGNGDLTSRINCNSHDELGKLTLNFNRFVTRVRSIVSEVQSLTSLVATSSSQISTATKKLSLTTQGEAASTEQISASIEGVYREVGEIAFSTGEQNKLVLELLHCMSSSSTMIKEINNEIEGAGILSSSIKTDSSIGYRTLQEMNQKMTDIISSSKEMTKVINIVNDISKKVNLLSINASIEAARAGEAGIGFTVVADEIGKLAKQTDKELEKIKSMVQLNHTRIQSGMEKSQETLFIIEKINEGIQRIDEHINQMHQYMLNTLENNQTVEEEAIQIKAMSEKINYVTKEETLAFQEIVEAITEINKLTQTIAFSSEELSEISGKLENDSFYLKKKVEFFQT
ncbi:MAG: methyl-accepting chemotaxis protein [Leptospiraceae bacterium]|nr:methyl-accepting chemotaxis protein [Leptospiraceae bacterium]MCP5500312.1 methyl-accepting chemotaxis protein [Leptospiraceae bacterium]